jgi:hypothetical protein
MSRSQLKAMLITFFNIKGTVHFEFIPQGQRVNQAYYMEILKQLHEVVRKKCLSFGPTIRFCTMTMSSRDNSMGCGLDDRELESWQELGIFLITPESRTTLGPIQPPI